MCARLRIHGTTRQQVWSHYLATDRPALGPLAPEPFVLFQCGTRTVHPDGHVEVAGAFYPVPPHLLGERVHVRWDARLVRVYHQNQLLASHVRTAPGAFARPPGQDGTGLTSSQQAFLHTLLGRCERVGPALRAWAVAAIAERGIRALRLIQGVLQLTRRHPREAVLHAAHLAREHRLFRYKDLQRLTDQGAPPLELELLRDYPAIRSMDAYRLEEFV